MITTEQVKALREKTGISVMQCKKALEEAGGDMDKALILLKKKGSEIAAKKSDRELGAGTIAAYVHSGGIVGAMVMLSTETDFVANNAEFRDLAYSIAMHVAASNPDYANVEQVPADVYATTKELFAEEVRKSGKDEDIQAKMLTGKLDTYFKEKALLSQPYIKNPDITIGQLIEEATQKFGERIEIAVFSRYSVR